MFIVKVLKENVWVSDAIVSFAWEARFRAKELREQGWRVSVKAMRVNVYVADPINGNMVCGAKAVSLQHGWQWTREYLRVDQERPIIICVHPETRPISHSHV